MVCHTDYPVFHSKGKPVIPHRSLHSVFIRAIGLKHTTFYTRYCLQYDFASPTHRNLQLIRFL